MRNSHQTIPTSKQTRINIPKAKEAHWYYRETSSLHSANFDDYANVLKRKKKNWFTLDWEWSERVLLQPKEQENKEKHNKWKEKY